MRSDSKVWICLTKLAFAVGLLSICECLDLSVVSQSVGQTATLPCHNVIQGTVQVVWKDKDLTTLTLNEAVLTDDRRFSIQHKYQNDWDMQINGVRLSDAGNYTCCFVLTSECQTIKIVTLVIQIPPAISGISNDVTVLMGGNLTLVCNATGVPKPTIRWLLYRPNAEGKALNTTGAFSIVAVQPGDAGRYECIANNGVLPTAYRSVQVIVTFKPQVTVPYREVRQKLNSDTLLECRVRSSPIDEFYWEKNGRRLDNEPGRYRTTSFRDEDETEALLGLTVYNLRSDDFAYYTCVAKNHLGIAMESALINPWHNGTLRMLSYPRDTIAQTGKSVIIDCTVEGMAKEDQLSWWHQDSGNLRYIKLFDSKNGGGLASESNIEVKRKYGIIGQYNLEIRSVTMENAGFYHCHVSNLGNFTANLAVVVQDSSIGSGCSGQTSGTSTMVTVSIVASLVGVFIIVFVVVVLSIVRHYRKRLTKRLEHSTEVKTERYSSLNPTSSYM